MGRAVVCKCERVGDEVSLLGVDVDDSNQKDTTTLRRSHALGSIVDRASDAQSRIKLSSKAVKVINRAWRIGPAGVVLRASADFIQIHFPLAANSEAVGWSHFRSDRIGTGL